MGYDPMDGCQNRAVDRRIVDDQHLFPALSARV